MKQGQSTCEPVSASSLLLLQLFICHVPPLIVSRCTRTSLWCCVLHQLLKDNQLWLQKELNTVGEKMSSSIGHFQHLAFAF
ncbi:hypothetical protein DFH11DRAFT_1588073 [Phellopilus nigrolimitatus]|nr:hypothetical protein DFH11DRAFT_1588073 [Phellopilus nigrolimitatus]